MTEVGRPGGEMRMLIARERETRFFHIYGYAKLVAFDRDLQLVPDLLAGYEVEDGRPLDVTLRGVPHVLEPGVPLVVRARTATAHHPPVAAQAGT